LLRSLFLILRRIAELTLRGVAGIVRAEPRLMQLARAQLKMQAHLFAQVVSELFPACEEGDATEEFL
jgi:hypothetical protein